VTDPPRPSELTPTRENIGRLRSLLAQYDAEQVAAVEARVRAACVTARPEEAEEKALAITLDVLRLRHRGDVHGHVHGHDQHALSRDEEPADVRR
jgi:hypothetical protein